MKLKNILFAGLATLLFTTSCSKDSGMPVVPGLGENGTLNLKMYASGAMKAGDDVALSGESQINNVGVALFSQETGLLMVTPFWGKADMGDDGIWTVLNIPSYSEKAKIVIVANCPQGLFANLNATSSYAAFQDELAKLEDQKQDNLTMSSQVITTQNALNMGDNYIGYESQGDGNINAIRTPLELTRLAARIEVASIRTSFLPAGNLSGRSVRINSIYIANESKASRFFSENYWGVVMASGNLGDSEATTIRQTTEQINGTVYTHYVMENDATEEPTQIVINATLMATNGSAAETKSFAATVNANGTLTTPGVAHKYVKRNHVYRLNINFTDSSFSGDPEPPTPPTPPTPVTGLLDVKVEVVSWGPVNQNVEIE